MYGEVKIKKDLTKMTLFDDFQNTVKEMDFYRTNATFCVWVG